MTVLAFRRQRRVFFKKRTSGVGTAAGILSALLVLALVGHFGSPSLASYAESQIASITDTAPEPAAGYLGITSVYDGDTFRIGAERIRIIGMDAPEIGSGAKCAREQKTAVEARDFLRNKLSGGRVRMERDGTDVYGRTLAYVYVDGHDIADTMIRADLALPYQPGQHGHWCELTAG